MKIQKNHLLIISGGQTGVDRAAWDAAILVGFPYFGFVPKGRLAEDGRIPDHYNCEELKSADYAIRTEKNLTYADATLVLCFRKPEGGTLLTLGLCKKLKRKVLNVDLDQGSSQVNEKKVVAFLQELRPRSLNVAGPRSSFRSDVYIRAYEFLSQIFKAIRLE